MFSSKTGRNSLNKLKQSSKFSLEIILDQLCAVSLMFLI